MQIVQIKSKEQAQQVSKFLSTENAFEDSKDWNKTEVEHLIKTPYRALENKNYSGWLVKEDDEVIGYIDLRQHEFSNDGYYSDWFVIHKDYRNKGIGSNILRSIEQYAKTLSARYILIETGDIDIYSKTRNFYEKNGFIKVGHIPEYYYKDWGMYIYQKML